MGSQASTSTLDRRISEQISRQYEAWFTAVTQHFPQKMYSAGCIIQARGENTWKHWKHSAWKCLCVLSLSEVPMLLRICNNCERFLMSSPAHSLGFSQGEEVSYHGAETAEIHFWCCHNVLCSMTPSSSRLAAILGHHNGTSIGSKPPAGYSLLTWVGFFPDATIDYCLPDHFAVTVGSAVVNIHLPCILWMTLTHFTVATIICLFPFWSACKKATIWSSQPLQ